MNTVDLHSLWNLRRTIDAAPSVYVNYIPNYPDKESQNIFYSSSMPDVSVGEFGISDQKATQFFDEIANSIDYRAAVESLPKIGNPYIYLISITRQVGDRWLSINVKPNVVHITLTPKVGSRKLDYREFDLSISALSGAARSMIRCLDRGVRRIAYERYVRTLGELESDGALLPPTPITEKVFISYRRQDGIELPQLVHRSLERYGNGVYFEPFLDLHDLKRGRWKDRILEALGASTIFMPVLTDGYAEEGTYGKVELDLALERIVRGDMDCVPVFLTDSESEHNERLSEYQGCMLTTSSQWEDEMKRGLDVVSRG